LLLLKLTNSTVLKFDLRIVSLFKTIYNYFPYKMPYEVPNDVIMYHEKRIEWNILISACMPYYGATVFGTYLDTVLHTINHYLLARPFNCSTDRPIYKLQQSHIRPMYNYADLRHT